MRRRQGIEPVVGWLVCVKGPDTGQDYRIKPERNFIGRSSEMDISIAGDERISRDRHAEVVYYPKTNEFKVAPGSSGGIVYLNGEPVSTAMTISPFDRVQLGASELVFVGLCGERFQWEPEPES